jgi:hypothetical protein
MFHMTPDAWMPSVAFGMLFTLMGAISISAAALNVGDRKQLFIDRKFIAASENVTLAMNPPEKRGVVLQGEYPWEAGWVGAGEMIIEDQGKCRMWYRCYSPGKDGKLGRAAFCYAESTDGIHWVKLMLGLVKWPGDEYSEKRDETNMLPLDGGTVFLDPSAPAPERYKMLRSMYWPDPARAGLYIGVSPDGLHWKTNSTRLLPFSPDTTNQVFYDTRLRKYVAYIRTWAPMRKVGRIEIERLFEPWPYEKTQKPNFIWGKDKVPVPSNEFHQAISYDELDPPQTDLYTPAVHQYAWADDAYFAFPSPYRHFPEPPKGKYGNDGLLDIQLAVSRDGVTFQRPIRSPYIPLGLRGGPEGGSMYMGIGMIRRGSEIYQYYTGFAHTHGEYVGFKELKGMGGIHLAVQRLDGFMSADFAYTGGTLTTPPLTFPGRRLRLNVNPSALGVMQVELRDATGAPVPGFTHEDCDPVQGNNVSAEVAWRGKSDVTALAGKAIQIHFTGRDAKLYAFQFSE